MDPLRGEYGFLTEFSNITEDEARARVRHMVKVFGILEYQFYNAFEGYSRPPDEEIEQWTCACFEKPVRRNIIMAYTDEIEKWGGRSWLSIQAMGTDPNDEEMQRGFTTLGQIKVNDQPLLDAVVPSEAWARRVAPHWARFASSLKFSGIHWNTLGDFNNAGEKGADVAGFLRTSLMLLDVHRLAQTASFVDGFGWDNSFLEGVGWVRNVIAFPYWEAKTVPAEEERFFEKVAPAPYGGGVFVCFPGKTADHKGERQNKLEKGVWPLDLLIKRWQKARCHGNSYLAIGDGYRHVQDEYLPDASGISDADITKIRKAVFKPVCPEIHIQKPRVAPRPNTRPQVISPAVASTSESTSDRGPTRLDVLLPALGAAALLAACMCRYYARDRSHSLVSGSSQRVY
jgi:hypothetical protein